MDAKNLAVLMTLKHAMEKENPKEPMIGNLLNEKELNEYLDAVKSKCRDAAADRAVLREQKRKIAAEQRAEYRRRLKENHQTLAQANADEKREDPQARTTPRTPWPKSDVFNPSGGSSPLKKTGGAGASTSLVSRQKISKKKRKSRLFRGVAVTDGQYKALKESMARMIYGDNPKALKKKLDALIFYICQAPEDREAMIIYEKVERLMQAEPGFAKPNPNQAWIKDDVAKLIASIKQREKPKAATGPAWKERICHWCSDSFLVHRDWISPPNRCKECRNKLKNTKIISPKKGGKTIYTRLVVFSGGAPGLGKRR